MYRRRPCLTHNGGARLLKGAHIKKESFMNKLLCDFAVGERGVISRVNGEGRVRRRLFDMGVTPGAEVTLVKKAPLGDPLELTIRGYQLTLRKAEAGCVQTEVAR